MNTFVLGAGVTGLAAGFTSGLQIFEASNTPGGICSSYYVRPFENKRLQQAPNDGEAYRFEIGGGHWIFGGDSTVLKFLRRFVSMKTYARRSSVYFKKKDLYVPYPLQNNLRYLEEDIAESALTEMTRGHGKFCTMKEWLEQYFGLTLCELFFYPFHELYTAGLYKKIAPQDAYKSPVHLPLVKKGAMKQVSQVGYNVNFIYPEEGLNEQSRRIADRSDIKYGKRVVKIDIKTRNIQFSDGSNVSYDKLISTLPLNKTIEMCGIELDVDPDPYSSVLVLNIGALCGGKCPNDHWLYTPDVKSGFHRVGFYSNVDRLFLPASAREKGDRVSIYVERAYPGGNEPDSDQKSKYINEVVSELQELQFIGDIEVVDPTWIDVGYTWSWPDSDWRNEAIDALRQNEIFQIGRYGRWVFQGIADSIREGLTIGSSYK